MVSVFVMGIVMAAVFSALRMGATMMEDTRHLLRAEQILQSEMENLRRMSWAQFSALPEKSEFSIDSRFEDLYADVYTGTRILTSPMSGMMDVRLEVTWQNLRGVQFRREFFTKVAQGGLNDFYYRTVE